jgi:hypothetical protein
MRKVHLIFYLIILCADLFSQPDSLNKFNSEGKKVGYWIKYLDSLIMPTDKSNAYFFGYEYYINGMTSFSFINYKFDKVVYNQKLPKKGDPIPLGSIIKQLHNYKGKLASYNELEIENGYVKTVKEFIVKQVNIETNHQSSTKDTFLFWTISDYEKKYNNIQGTAYQLKYLNVSGKPDTSAYWFREANGKWKWYREK